MGMEGFYRHATSKVLDALAQDESLTESVVLFDAEGESGGLPAEARQLLSQVPPEMREKLEAQLKTNLGGLSDDLSQGAKRRLAPLGIGADDLGETLSVDKAWHGLQFLLGDEKPDVALGGREIGDDLGLGPARVMTPAEVQEAARRTAAISEEELRARFDPEKIREQEIYAIDPDEPEEIEWLLDAFRAVRAYFAEAAAAGRGMILWLS